MIVRWHFPSILFLKSSKEKCFTSTNTILVLDVFRSTNTIFFFFFICNTAHLYYDVITKNIIQEVILENEKKEKQFWNNNTLDFQLVSGSAHPAGKYY